MTTETETAWAAGFFDGEGSAGVHRPQKNRYAYLILQVSQRRLEPLQRFAAAVESGKIRGPYKNPGHGGTPLFKWTAVGAAAHVAANVLQPYLSTPKREQLDHALNQLRDHGRI